MTDTAAFDLEGGGDPRSARLRLARRGAALAVSALLVAGLLAAVAHDEGRDESRVATASIEAPAEPEEVEDLVADVPTTVTSAVPLPVTVPKVTIPKLPRLPSVKVPTVTVPPVTVPAVAACQATPPPYEPPPQLGTYAISTAGGTGRLVKAWGEHEFMQDHTYSPDGRHIAYVQGWTDNDGQTPWKLVIADTELENGRHVPTGTHGPSGVRWSPDGRHIAFVAQPEAGKYHSIFVLDTTTHAVRQVSDSAANGISWPDWSPDGKRLAWGGGWAEGSVTGVWVAEIGSTIEVAKLTDDNASYVDWSPDGAQLAFTRHRGGAYVVDRDGSDRRLLHPEGTGVAWSPTDRSRLVVDVRGALHRVDPDTGVAVFLAGGNIQGWLPDGTRLVSGSHRGMSLVGWDGCVQTVFTGDMVAMQAWSPDSKTLLFFRTWPYGSR